MNVNELYPKRFGTGADLAKPVTVTISRVVVERMRPAPNGPEVERPVIYFADAKRGVVLSRVLATQIASVLQSNDTDAWVGGKVVLYSEHVRVAGIDRIAVRARAVAP